MNKKQLAAARSLMKRIRAQDDEVYLYGPCSPEATAVAEDALGVTFPRSYRVFLETFGGVDIWNEYLGGIADSKNPLKVGRGNVYFDTMYARKEIGLPEHMVVIQIDDDEWFECLDTSQMKRGECPVIGVDRPPMRGRSVRAKSFAEHFLNFLEGHLEEE